MLKERTLDHQQVYQYKVHLAKLALMVDAVPADVAAKVKSYLLSIFEDFPDVLFQDDRTLSLDQQAALDNRPPEPPTAMRPSKSRFAMLPLSRTEKKNLANDLAALGLLLARKFWSATARGWRGELAATERRAIIQHGRLLDARRDDAPLRRGWPSEIVSFPPKPQTFRSAGRNKVRNTEPRGQRKRSRRKRLRHRFRPLGYDLSG